MKQTLKQPSAGVLFLQPVTSRKRSRRLAVNEGMGAAEQTAEARREKRQCVRCLARITPAQQFLPQSSGGGVMSLTRAAGEDQYFHVSFLSRR